MLPPYDHCAEGAVVPPSGVHAEPHARLAEANHRIANNLSLVVGLIRAEAKAFAARAAPAGPREVARILEAIAARVEAVGQLHRLLSADTGRSTVDLAEYLTGVCEAVTAFSRLDAGVALSTRLSPGCRMRPDQILPLALIVSEAVTNAVKYAHPAGAPGWIEVSCRREADGRLLVEVADDGVGLPDGFDPLKDGGLGVQVMRGLARQLGAAFALESAGLGLTVRVHLPAGPYPAT